MIKVVYQWRVEPSRFAEFRALWASVTESIHETVPGALGSFMLRADDDPRKVLTVAKWQSKSDWQAFWQTGNPEQMAKMRSLGQRISVDVFDEIEDRTKP